MAHEKAPNILGGRKDDPRIQRNHIMCDKWEKQNYLMTAEGNVKNNKKKSTDEVDGAVALVMAPDRGMKNNNGGSVYDNRRLLFL